MATVNGWLFFPMHESLNRQDLAIRRFCPAARVKQEQAIGGGGEEEAPSDSVVNDQMEQLWSPTDADTRSSTPPPPPLPTSEEEEFVDSFFNLDYCCDLIDDSIMVPGKTHDDHDEVFDHFDDQDELFENLSSIIVDDHVYAYGDGKDIMMIEGDDQLDEIAIMTSTSIIIDHHDHVADHQQVVSMSSHGDGEVDQGLQLVHLLLACAEAVGCRDTQLADSILCQIWPWVSPLGDSLQRVSYCFAMGLKCRLSLLLNNLNANGTIFTTSNGFVSAMNSIVSLSSSTITIREEEMKMEAFQLLHQSTPYIAFGFMAANDAICQAAKGMDSLHVIDLGMQHTLQWPSFIRTLASRPEGPPKLLRITGLVRVGDHHHHHHQQLLDQLQASIKGLIDEAGSLGISLEFHLIEEQSTTPSLLLTKENLNLREGEALFVNSIMHLHTYVKESRGSLKTILQAIKKLGPTLLTVVEQDANHNGPFFLGRFLESLHYYSAIFDSLEAILPRNSPQRMKIEKMYLAEEINNIIAYEGSNRIERHEKADQWRRQLGRAGFQGVGMKDSMSQARMMISVYGCDGYTLASDKGCLLLGWKGRPIMLASAWQVHNNVPKVMSN
ncbi:unnamed protein product [Camellia sinensis]